MAVTDASKSHKQLEKKWRQVQELEGRRAKGETLNEDQLAKLTQKPKLEEELQALGVDLNALNGTPAAPAKAAPKEAAVAPAKAPKAAPKAAPAKEAPAAVPEPVKSVAPPAEDVEKKKAQPKVENKTEPKVEQKTEPPTKVAASTPEPAEPTLLRARPVAAKDKGKNNKPEKPRKERAPRGKAVSGGFSKTLEKYSCEIGFLVFLLFIACVVIFCLSSTAIRTPIDNRVRVQTQEKTREPPPGQRGH